MRVPKYRKRNSFSTSSEGQVSLEEDIPEEKLRFFLFFGGKKKERKKEKK